MTVSLLDEAEDRLRRGDASGCAQLCRQAIAATRQGDPEHGEAHSLLGLALIGAEMDTALEHLRRAAAFEPEEPQFRMNLAEGLIAAGRAGEAEAELRRAAALSRGHPAPLLRLSRLLIADGRAAESETLLRRILAADPDNGRARRLLAEALFDKGDAYGADEALRRAVGERPERREDALMVAKLAQRLQEYDRALDVVEPLLEVDPPDREAVLIAARLGIWRGDPGCTDALVDRALEAYPGDAELIELRLDRGDAGEDELERFYESARAAAPEAEARILYALAQHNDRMRDADRAWAAAQKANSLVKALRKPPPAGEMERKRQVLFQKARLLGRGSDRGAKGKGPGLLYLCGAPRSGGSLVQSVLAAAPGAASVGERAALLPSLHAMLAGKAKGGSARLAALGDADLKGLARLAPDAAHYIDKTPENMMFLGPISAVHPGARFLCLLRDPAECVVSIFIRGFNPVFDYSYAAATIADYLIFNAEAAAAWIEDGYALRLAALEDFLAAAEKEAAAIADWAGIDWSSDCLDPGRRTQPVPTFSARQVRGPIAPGAGWRREAYAEYLMPLEGKLARIGDLQARLMDRRAP
ncbi:MAG: sulfotransferase [Sphingomonadaceae bacterium]